MRVNVLKSLSISKTFMKSGLKLLKYHYSLRKIKTKTKSKSKSKTKSKSKSKTKSKTTTISNNLTLEFYLNLYTNVKETLLHLDILANLKLLVNFAIFASYKRILLIGIFTFNVAGFSRLAVLMNVFRLKTFYNNNNNNSNSQTFKILNLILNTSSINIKPKELSTLTTTRTSRIPSTLPLSNCCVLFRSSSSDCNSNNNNNNNNHNNNNNKNNYRTYNNNNKKSNKVFLNYTPRDPRLRIFLKTKHFLSSRPFLQYSAVALPRVNNNKNKNKNKNNNRSDKILNDLCNYGELIGGGSSSDHKRVQFQRFFYSVAV